MVKKNNFVPVQDLAGNILMVEPDKKKRGRPPKKQAEENITMVINEVKKRGRPKKYSTAEEARKAKIANTIASAKKRKGKGIREIQKLSKRTDLSSLQNRLSPADVELLSGQAERPHIFKTIGELQQLLQAQHDLGNYNNEIDPNKSLYDELTLRGEGILGDLYSGAKKIVKKATKAVVKVADKVKDTATAVIYGRNDYPPKVRNIISKYGDKNITGITLGRTPLGTPLLTALQVASGNTFSQKLENTPYDTLFHLFICIQLDSKDRITFEKNEVINAENTCKSPKETETKTITSSDIPQGLTLNDALNKTKERMGGKYFTYSAKDNNCQDFIVAFLTANNIGTETDKSWVKQETKVLFEGNDRLRKIANTLTDIGARFDVIKQGVGTKRKKKGGMVDEENDPLFQNPLPIVANPPPPPPPPEPIVMPEPPIAIKKESRKGGKIKSPNNNIGMANKWIEYVKAYAKKNNMKYSEALKDPKCKAGYKSGEGIFDVLKEVGKAVAPVAIDLASNYAKKKISGSGMPTSRDEYISQLYDQANLGANGKVRLN
jgi:hypothetical protein